MSIPATQIDPSSTLHLSQQAPSILAKLPPPNVLFPFTLLDKPESPVPWIDYERLFQACLRAGDDKAAHVCVERLADRFGASDNRVIGLRGMYQEAVAGSAADLEKVLHSYDKIIESDPMNVPILKRRVAVKKSLSRPHEAITALVEFLESNVTDPEAWYELADLYQSQGMTAQAIFCIEEALLVTPNAWNLHARLGELEYSSVAAGSDNSEATRKLLADAVRRFSRSIELCDDYLRGYYGLKKASQRLLQAGISSNASAMSVIPPASTVSSLHELASQKLKDIVHARNAQSSLSDSTKAELIAAQALLDESS